MSGNKKRRRKKKVVVKKRFYVFCLIFLLLIGTGIYFAAKAIVNVVSMNSPDAGKTVTQEKEPVKDSDVQGQEGKDASDTSDGADNTVTDSGKSSVFSGVQPAVMTEDPAEETVDGQEGGAALTQEQQIRKAVLSSWYINPLGQRRETVEQSFGKLIRYEEWGGGIYYHSKFAETMYITYDGNLGEDKLPEQDSVCTSVSIVMKRIMEFEEFKPSSVWGNVNKDKSGEGWSDYFYSIMIKDNINLIVYCDEEGNVNQDTHIIVRTV
ncbi:MAG: hypothetical protein Q4C14_08030 [Bacillota bacterium]|nr:hypothetical protein [Bacillota bacterium]